MAFARVVKRAPLTHDGGVDGAAGGLHEAVDELGHDEEEEAERVVPLHHADVLEVLYRAEADGGADEADADDDVRRVADQRRGAASTIHLNLQHRISD